MDPLGIGYSMSLMRAGGNQVQLGDWISTVADAALARETQTSKSHPTTSKSARSTPSSSAHSVTLRQILLSHPASLSDEEHREESNQAARAFQHNAMDLVIAMFQQSRSFLWQLYSMLTAERARTLHAVQEERKDRREKRRQKLALNRERRHSFDEPAGGDESKADVAKDSLETMAASALAPHSLPLGSIAAAADADALPTIKTRVLHLNVNWEKCFITLFQPFLSFLSAPITPGMKPSSPATHSGVSSPPLGAAAPPSPPHTRFAQLEQKILHEQLEILTPLLTGPLQSYAHITATLKRVESRLIKATKASWHRSFLLSGGAVVEQTVSVVSDYLGEYVQRLFTLLRRIRRAGGFMDETSLYGFGSASFPVTEKTAGKVSTSPPVSAPNGSSVATSTSTSNRAIATSAHTPAPRSVQDDDSAWLLDDSDVKRQYPAPMTTKDSGRGPQLLLDSEPTSLDEFRSFEGAFELVRIFQRFDALLARFDADSAHSLAETLAALVKRLREFQRRQQHHTTQQHQQLQQQQDRRMSVGVKRRQSLVRHESNSFGGSEPLRYEDEDSADDSDADQHASDDDSAEATLLSFQSEEDLDTLAYRVLVMPSHATVSGVTSPTPQSAVSLSRSLSATSSDSSSSDYAQLLVFDKLVSKFSHIGTSSTGLASISELHESDSAQPLTEHATTTTRASKPSFTDRLLPHPAFLCYTLLNATRTLIFDAMFKDIPERVGCCH